METEFDTHKTSAPGKNRVSILQRKVGMDKGHKAVQSHIEEDRVVVIPIDKLVPNPFQPRTEMDEEKLFELAASIKEYGVLQPIIITPLQNGIYMIRYGHRRVKASQKAGNRSIRAIIKHDEINDQSLISEALIENMQRENMHIVDIALSMQMAIERKVYKNPTELAKKIGIDKSQVSRILKILTLPEDILQDITKNKTITDRVVLDHLRKIIDETKCRETYQWYIKNNPTREEFIDNILDPKEVEISVPIYTMKKTSKGCTIKTGLLTEEQEQELQLFIKQLLG
ncbi:MAG: ParB/RepB/Spo0J family partition protein [Sulfurovaceae bacterium]|nr:ParB/RepB/Spo0J family partition protein [Sulfurovaceae bacterium]